MRSASTLLSCGRAAVASSQANAVPSGSLLAGILLGLDTVPHRVGPLVCVLHGRPGAGVARAVPTGAMGACFLTWSSPHQGFAIIPLLASWMLLIRWCVSHMLSKRVVSHMLSKRVVSHKRTGNTSGARRVD